MSLRLASMLALVVAVSGSGGNARADDPSAQAAGRDVHRSQVVGHHSHRHRGPVAKKHVPIGGGRAPP